MLAHEDYSYVSKLYSTPKNNTQVTETRSNLEVKTCILRFTLNMYIIIIMTKVNFSIYNDGETLHWILPLNSHQYTFLWQRKSCKSNKQESFSSQL